MHRRYEPSSELNTGAALELSDFLQLVRTHVRWWAIPAVACALLAGAYSLVAPRNWLATQAFIVRPEAASVSEERLGKFGDLSEMKTLQETILEIAKSQSVARATLGEVGAPDGYRRPAEWPTPLDIEAFRGAIDMRPPGGAEFGKTEVFYLSVKNASRDRASLLVAALCNQLERRMQELRDQNAKGMVAELERTVAMANNDLSGQITRLSSFESKVGADLAELRVLNAENATQGGASQELQAIESERRANDSHLRENQVLLKVLVAAKEDPQQLLATPNTLLVSQPAVNQLKNALVAAQLRTASLLGSREEAHPFVIAAREAENRIRQQLNSEVGIAIRGLQIDIDLSSDREKSLASKYNATRERIARLAGGRAEYANLVASVQNHTRLVEAARKNLADARARSAAAHSGNVLSRIDKIEAGVRPTGPGRKTITAAGGLGGFALGFGLVFLFGTRKPIANVPSTIVGAFEMVNDPGVAPPQSTKGNFGMFRGMTLEEAILNIKSRKQSEA
jgi:polysaccharide biosynthesis transport protein